jgi:hypothetical protein
MDAYFVTYEGRLDDEARVALSRPGWTLYENGVGSTAGYEDEEMPPIRWRQVVRVPARTANDALDLVIQALGERPPGIRVAE